MSAMPHQIVVRVTDEMLAALRADAVANGRTVAQSVRFHLRPLCSQEGPTDGD